MGNFSASIQAKSCALSLTLIPLCSGTQNNSTVRFFVRMFSIWWHSRTKLDSVVILCHTVNAAILPDHMCAISEHLPCLVKCAEAYIATDSPYNCLFTSSKNSKFLFLDLLLYQVSPLHPSGFIRSPLLSIGEVNLYHSFREIFPSCSVGGGHF